MNGSSLDPSVISNSSGDNDSPTRHIDPGNHFRSYESRKRNNESSSIPAAFTWTPPTESDVARESNDVRHVANEIPYAEMQQTNHWANNNVRNSHLFCFLPNVPHHVAGLAPNFPHWYPNYPMSGSIQQPTEIHRGGFMEAHMPYGSVPSNTPNHTMPPPFQGSFQWLMQNGSLTERHVDFSNGMHHPGFFLNHASTRRLLRDFRVSMNTEQITVAQTAPTLASSCHGTELMNGNLPKKHLPTPDLPSTKSELEQKVLAMDIFVTDPPRYNSWLPPRLGKMLKSYLAGFVILPDDLKISRRDAVNAINGRIKSRIGKHVEPVLLSKLMISLRKRLKKSNASTDDSG